MVVDITVFFIISTFVTILRSCEFEVDNPVDGKDIKEEETMEVFFVCNVAKLVSNIFNVTIIF